MYFSETKHKVPFKLIACGFKSRWGKFSPLKLMHTFRLVKSVFSDLQFQRSLVLTDKSKTFDELHLVFYVIIE